MPLVDAVARRILRRVNGQLPLDDLVSIGREALIDAVHTYEPGRACFRTYAGKKVAWAIYDGVRRETHGRCAAARSLRVAEPAPVAEESSPPDALDLESERAPAEPVEPDDHASEGDDPEAFLCRRQTGEALRRAVRDLPERERALVERHYFAGEPFESIAEDLGISRSWASRLHTQAIRALADAIHEPSRSGRAARRVQVRSVTTGRAPGGVLRDPHGASPW